VEEAGTAQVSGDLHKAQRFDIHTLLPGQTMAAEIKTSLQRKRPRRNPLNKTRNPRPRSTKNSTCRTRRGRNYGLRSRRTDLLETTGVEWRKSVLAEGFGRERESV
jgi:hypothetical protein